ncbi:hypothetical protein D3C86_1496420 [compost metagenome]
MAVHHDAHAQLGQAAVVAQFGIAVGDQHQRDVQVFGDGLEVLAVLHADQADAVGAGGLVGLGAVDHLFQRLHAGVGAGDDRHRRIVAYRQRGAQFADAFLDADQVVGFTAVLGRQQGVLEGQGGNAGALQLDDGTHGVVRVAVAVVGVGDHRQAGDTADAGGLLGELAEGDHGDVRRGEHLQGGNRATEDADLEAEVGGDTCRQGVEYRSGVVTGGAGEQGTEGFAQLVMTGFLHGLFSSGLCRLFYFVNIAKLIPKSRIALIAGI